MLAEQLLQIKDLKSPKGHLILGHLPQFKDDSKHLVLERWIEECGDLFKINFVGKEFIVSSNPDINQEILKQRPDKFKRFSKINEIFEEMGIVGVFNAEGETWKKHRKPIAEALKLKNIKGYYPVILDKTEKLLTKWNAFADSQQEVDVQREFMFFTIDITTAIAFGYQLDTINNKGDGFQKHLEYIFPMINERITAPIPYWRFFKLKKDKELDKSLQEIEKLIYQFINEAKKRIEQDPELRTNPSNFLEALLVEQEADKFDDKEIYGNVFTMMLAGEDTTSNSISWAIFYLAQHPEMVQKIRDEANAVYGNQSTIENHEQCDQLVYTNAVVQEAIRIKPTTPQLYLEAIEDVTVQNFFMPKGTRVITQNKAVQTHEDYFTNANDFIPERWIKGGCPMHQHHSPEVIKAFGAGPRFCPGKFLALTEMTVLISALCKNFDFKMTVKPEEVKEQFAFTMHPENLLVKLSHIK